MNENLDNIKIFSDAFAQRKNQGKNREFSATDKKGEQAAEEKALMDLANRFPERITMFGYRVKSDDPAFPNDRKQMDLHPYTKQGTGVSCTVAYTDAHSGEIVVLLGKKKNKAQYDQIGGYTKGQGPVGSEIVVDKRSDDQKDLEEEAIIGNKQAVTVKETTAKSSNVSYTLEQLKQRSTAIFIEQQREKPGQLTIPSLMKKHLKEAGVDYPNDFNALDTALRELKEETGLDLAKSKQLFSSDDFGISNEDPRLHTSVVNYVFYLGRKTSAEIQNEFPVKPGSDLESLKWVSVSQFERSPDAKEIKVKGDMPIRMSYAAQTLPRAIEYIRQKELKECSGKAFSKHKNVVAQLKLHLKGTGHNVEDILPRNSSDPYSDTAHLYHLTILGVAAYLVTILREHRPFNLAELKAGLEPTTPQFKEFIERIKASSRP